jgi:phosphoribosylaminoimidazole carboxylase (NCAIR synthetase)
MNQANDILLMGQLIKMLFTQTSQLGQNMLTYELHKQSPCYTTYGIYSILLKS